MTDMYIRRTGGAGMRVRILLVILALLAVGAAAFFAIRALRGGGEDDHGESPMEGGPGQVASPSTPPAAASPAPVAADRKPSGAAAKPAPTPAAKPGGPGAADSGIALIAAAEQLADQGQLLEAREKAWETLEVSSHEPARDRARTLLGQVHTTLLTTPRSMPEKTEYTVRSGDSLAKLAKDFDTTIELIQRSNNISGSMIRIGDRLRIFQGDFHVHVDKSDNLLDLYLNDRFFKRYAVGTGEYNRTPVGEFHITDRIHQPTWWRPDGRAIPYGDPENELGTHWLSLDIRGYGLHGTWEPDTIGRQASAGCIRLTNDNIAELYMLLPIGTTVTIAD